MEFYHLNTFVTVARTGNVRKAAKLLNTTPPSVSGHIKALEEECGIRLFSRTPKGMKITAQGETLKDKALEILNLARDFHKTAAAVQHKVKGHLKLGINADSNYLKLPLIIKNLYKEYPHLHLEIENSNTGKIMNDIEQGKIDCGFVFGKYAVKNLEMIPLSFADIVIAVPYKYKASHSGSGWEELVSLPWIVPTNLCPILKTVQDFLDKKGFALSNTVFANDDITKNTLIREGAAVTAIEKNEAMYWVKEKSVFIWKNAQRLNCQLSLTYSSGRSDDILIRTIASVITKIWHPQTV